MKQKHLEIPPETLINILIVGRKQDVGGGGREGGEEGVKKVISTAWGEWEVSMRCGLEGVSMRSVLSEMLGRALTAVGCSGRGHC